VSWTDSFAAVSALSAMDERSRVWIPGPATASMNLFARVHADHIGAAVVDASGLATHAVLTPAALDRLVTDRERSDVGPGNLTVIVAGDRLRVALHDRARTAGLVVHHYYGAAELSFVAWGRHADDLRPFPGVQVDVRAGEIWVRSSYLCAGYAGVPGPLRTDERGFATVGDRGLLDGGRLLVHGRPGTATTAGATVSLADVEGVLRPAARGDVIVVGVPHPTLGEVLVAVLTDADDRTALVARARKHLSPACRPRRWHHLPQLPLTSVGKVDRARLAAQLSGPTPPRRLK
jgi:long-chain acyl-CoA synthetase